VSRYKSFIFLRISALFLLWIFQLQLFHFFSSNGRRIACVRARGRGKEMDDKGDAQSHSNPAGVTKRSKKRG
jgi:hypothetical protein